MKTHNAKRGISLIPFSANNADLVLSWRNSPTVRSNSLDDRELKRADHLQFVANLANREDRQFFIVEIDGTPLAIFNVDHYGPTARWGCYLGDTTKLVPGLFPILVGLSGKISFARRDCQEVKSEVLSRNTSPINLNAFLGIEQIGQRVATRYSGEKITVLEYRLPRANWNNVQFKLMMTLTKGQRLLLDEMIIEEVV